MHIRPWILKVLLLSVAVMTTPASPVAAVDRAEGEETARLLAKLLSAGRIVIDHHQALIDDASKGEKGFTPAVFEQQIVEQYKLMTGIDLHNLQKSVAGAPIPALARELLPAFLEASKSVVHDAQLVINQRGIGYKNFIPATYGSQAARRFSQQSHVRLKQTALQARNPKNEPDDYEASVLQWLSGRPRAEAYVSELTDRGQTLRVVMPIYYEPECLKCHGEPKGDLDIAGYPKEGHHEGDLAGAITVNVPLGTR
ncbi:MAG: DUF3365 domain-containing protein [Nitrospiraceae bacterium]